MRKELAKRRQEFKNTGKRRGRRDVREKGPEDRLTPQLQKLPCEREGEYLPLHQTGKKRDKVEVSESFHTQ